MRRGYWATHEYTRHSVKEIDEFVGWGKLRTICEAGTSPRDRAFPAALFELGTRVSECIQLRRSHFDLSDPAWVRCVEVPIVKQKIAKTRTFSFFRDEPLFKFVEKYLVQLKADEMLFPFGRNNALKLVYKLADRAGMGGQLWNHWFRSQRACQMGSEYTLTENDLMEWFKVKDRSWARRYCKKGDWGLRNVFVTKKPAEWHE